MSHGASQSESALRLLMSLQFGRCKDNWQVKMWPCLCGAEIKTGAPSDSWQCLIHTEEKCGKISKEFLFYFSNIFLKTLEETYNYTKRATKKNPNDAKLHFENQKKDRKEKRGTQMKETELQATIRYLKN